jgi:predicted transcriptional regulator
MVRVLPRASPRDRIDIIAAILAISNGGATRRQILVRSGLSTEQFKRYLYLLREEGYIRTEQRTEDGRRKIKIYRTTSKGIALLVAYNNITELLA